MINCCGEKHYGGFPQGVEKAVQYGERIQSLAVIFNVECRLTMGQIKKLLQQLYASSLNQSTLLNAMRECFANLERVEAEIKGKILDGETVHFDQAERDLRNVKVKQKISNSFRTAEGADTYVRIQGFVSTLKKQKMFSKNET